MQTPRHDGSGSLRLSGSAGTNLGTTLIPSGYVFPRNFRRAFGIIVRLWCYSGPQQNRVFC